MDLPDLSGIKIGFDLFRSAVGLAKDVKDIANPSTAKAIEKSLDEAMTVSVVAEAQIAKSLGYKLHKCTWPPQIMLHDHYDEHGREYVKCPKCGAIDPPPRKPLRVPSPEYVV